MSTTKSMKKSSSLPGILTLGSTAPKGIDANHTIRPSLTFKVNHGACDTHPGPFPSVEAFRAADKLAHPGWRQREHAALPRPASATSLQDLGPKNTRHPRIALSWLKHDKQVLRFYGFFQEAVVERLDENSRYRQVVFMYFMEDDTLTMTEPKVENSGIPQGAFLKRHRVPRADGQGVIGPLDFQIGEQLTVYGRTYQITGCDRFTRSFYKENGIELGEEEKMMQDTWNKSYKFGKTVEKGLLPISNQAMEAKNLTKYMVGQPPPDRKFKQFLLCDRKVLRFKAYWDDQTLYGARLYFVMHYYLSDNTVEINEAHSRNSGRDSYPGFMKRGPLLKANQVNAYPGMLSTEGGKYMPEDLFVGESINVWGRTVVLYECDDFTRKFYKNFLDIDQAENKVDVSTKPIKHLKLAPPPHNGIGTEEDSLNNCNSINPQPARPDIEKLMRLGGENLRFEAVMDNSESEDENRRFIIIFFPDTDRVAVHELQQRNSGHMAGRFAEKARVKNPATGRWFEMMDFFVGATVNIAAQPFKIIRADEHALKFLEEHADQFVYADPVACAQKLRPLAGEPEMQDASGLSPDSLHELAKNKGVQLVDHEVITLLRRFGSDGEEGPVISGLSVLQAC